MFTVESRHRSVFLPKLLSEAFDMSRNEARKIILSGGFKIDGEKHPYLTTDAGHLDGAVCQVGKRRFVRTVHHNA